MAKLLFFDTFHQDICEDNSVSSGWSIINFPCFVVIEEILIVPNGSRISDHIPIEGRRHGETHPPQFRVDFYACEANNQLSSTYEKLCMIDYNENTRTTVLPRLPFILNQLLCNGWYKSMTIAVFGSEAGDSQAVHLIHERRAKGMNLTSEVLIRPKQPDINFLLPQHMQPPICPPPFPPNNPPQMPPVSVQQQQQQQQDGQQQQQRNNFNFNGGGGGGGGRNDFFMKNLNDEQQQFGVGYGDDRRHGNRRKMYNNNRRDQLDSAAQQRHMATENRINEVMAKQIHSLLKKVRGKDDQGGASGRSDEHRSSKPRNKVRFQSPEFQWRGNSHNNNSNYHHHHQQQQQSSSASPSGGASSSGDHRDVAGSGDMAEAGGCLHDDDVDACVDDDDDDVMDDLLLPQTMMNFNPFEVDVYPLYYFRPPEETAYESLLAKDAVDKDAKCAEYKKLKAAISKYSVDLNEDRDVCVQNLYDSVEAKEWVLMLEEITPLVNPHLSRVEKESEDEARLVAFWAVAAVILEGPLFGKMCLNVRVIKAGLNLILSLTQTSETNVTNMCEFGLINELYTLLRGPYTSTTIKLAALHCIDGLTNWPLHVDYILLGPREKGAKSGYVHLIEMVLERQSDRVAESLKRLLRKLHLYESMNRIGEETRAYANTAMMTIQEDICAVGSDDYDISDMLIDQYDDEFDDQVADPDSDSKDVPTPSRSPLASMEVDGSTPTPLDQQQSSSTSSTKRVRRNSAEIELFDDESDDQATSAQQQQSQPQQENKNDHTPPQQYHSDEPADVRERMRSLSSSFGVGDYLSLDMVKGLDWVDEITNEELDRLAACLQDIEQVFSSPFQYIGQLPLKMMPIIDQRLNDSKKAVIEKNTQRAKLSLLRMSNHTELLPSILVLLTLPRINANPQLFRSCYRIITNLLNSEHGILHATGATNFAAIAQLSRNLMCSSVELDIGRPGTAGHLGALIACNIQVMQSMDVIGRILDTLEDIGPVDVDELLEALKSLYALHYLPWGKPLVGKALSLGKNFELLLKCVWFMEKELGDEEEKSSSSGDGVKKEAAADEEAASGDNIKTEKSDSSNKTTVKPEPTTTTTTTAEKTEEKKEEESKPTTTTTYKSAVNSYGSLLLLNVLKRNNEVRYLVNHAEMLVERCVSGDFISTRSNELRQWLKPLTCVDTSSPQPAADVVKLMNVIKDGCGESESITSQLLASFCMTLRLLIQRSGVCVDDEDKSTSVHTSLEQQASLLMLIHADGYNILLRLAEKLVTYLQPLSRSNIPLPVNGIETHHTIISLLTHLLQLISVLSKHLLNIQVKSQVIDVERITAVVLNLHSVSYGVLWSLDHPTLHQITRYAVTILARHLLPAAPKDCGAKMLDAIVAHARARCDHFLPALTLLTNLLPMPLPISISEENAADSNNQKHYARVKSVAQRTCASWAAIVEPALEPVAALLIDLMTSSCRPLLDVVVVCLQQVCDLSPEIAVAVAKKFLAQLRQIVVVKKKDDAAAAAAPPIDGNAFIATVCEVLTLPMAKQAFLSLLGAGGDELVAKEFWLGGDDDACCEVLLSMASVLVDDDISLLGDDNKYEVEKRACCVVPPLKHLVAIAELAVSKFAACTKTDVQLMENATTVLMKLAANRLTRPIVHNAIVDSSDSLLCGAKILKEMATANNKLQHPSTSLLNLVDLLHSLTHKRHADDDVSKMGYAELAFLFQGDFPLLLQLERQLETHVGEWGGGEEPESLALDRLASLRQMMTSSASRKRAPERYAKIELPAGISFQKQCEARQTVVCGGRDRTVRWARAVITSSALTRVVVADGNNNGTKMVDADLVALGEKMVGKEMDLAKELTELERVVADMRKKCDDMTEVVADPHAVTALVSAEAYSALTGAGRKLTYAKRSHGLLFHHHHHHNQQQRNKNGGVRGGIHHRVGAFNPHNRPYDLFRHRKQNTSRPPSMHVDDYMAADDQLSSQGGGENNNMAAGMNQQQRPMLSRQQQQQQGGIKSSSSGNNQRLNQQQQRLHHQAKYPRQLNNNNVGGGGVNFSRGGGGFMPMGQRRGSGFAPGQRRFDNNRFNRGNNNQQQQSVRSRLGFQQRDNHFNKLQRSNNEGGGGRYNDGGGRFGGGRYYMPTGGGKYGNNGGGNKRSFNSR